VIVNLLIKQKKLNLVTKDKVEMKQAQTKIRSWKTDEDFDPNFKKMVVVGIIERMSVRSEIEESIVIQARIK